MVVEQAARRGHQDVDAALELRHLRAEADAAEHAIDVSLQMLAVGFDGCLDLRREFARRREDQRAQRLARPAAVRRRAAWTAAAGSAARSRRSCRCRSARRPAGRRRRARREWPGPGSAWGRYSPDRRPRATVRSDSPSVENDMTAFEWVLGHSPHGAASHSQTQKLRRSDRLRQEDWNKRRWTTLYRNRTKKGGPGRGARDRSPATTLAHPDSAERKTACAFVLAHGYPMQAPLSSTAK